MKIRKQFENSRIQKNIAYDQRKIFGISITKVCQNLELLFSRCVPLLKTNRSDKMCVDNSQLSFIDLKEIARLLSYKFLPLEHDLEKGVK